MSAGYIKVGTAEFQCWRCNHCSAVIMDPDQHDKWHAENDRKIAYAGRNAGLMDRIG